MEISIAASIYNINISTYNAVLNSNNNPTGYSFINYYSNNDNSNVNRHLKLLINYNNVHCSVAYSRNKDNIDMQFEIPVFDNNIDSSPITENFNSKNKEDLSIFFDKDKYNSIVTILNQLKTWNT